MLERLKLLFFPSLIFISSIYASINVDLLSPLWLSLLPLLPFIMATLALVLAWHFNKGRVLVLVLLLLLPKLYGDYVSEGSFVAYLVVSCLCIALLSFLPERGLMNRFVINRLLFIFMLVTWCYAIEQKWVSFSFLNFTFLQTNKTWSDVLLWGVLLVSLSTVFLSWWSSRDAFKACGFISILSLIGIHYFSFSGHRLDVLLAAQFLLWIWFALMEGYRMAYLDDMTKLPARRALNERLIGLSKRYAIAMVDVDFFKKFNDSYGHDMGDRVLQNVADQMKRWCSPGKAFRYGGEEFTIVFSNDKKEEIKEVLENVRLNIEESLIEVFDPKKKKDMEVSVTVSIGLALAEQGEAPDSTLKRADAALYVSKKKGRNRVTIA
ncbi:GGDEF domain-containing protein [Marinomonas sp. C2222]|uniref:diguanylate cyclase n=1 Tax=Marinomonas sargassi TaxID=2984494 RepID=A0ABT2YNH5_9GAMM|nr:GGDEF domain-containing protein [Marinomonas sargassi]MCV2401440.1 GGDEF domain-containing protein [Marinomonas sargassi]